MVLTDRRAQPLPVLVGRLAHRAWTPGPAQVLPFMLVGMVLAIASGAALNSLPSATTSRSRSAGGSGPLRLRGALAITLLTGAAVAVAGPIVFLGR